VPPAQDAQRFANSARPVAEVVEHGEGEDEIKRVILKEAGPHRPAVLRRARESRPASRAVSTMPAS
jgi:hypothetical protein